MPVTDPAVAVKLPVVAPADTVTDAGTGSALLLPETVTDVLAVGAAETVTVQVEVAPDATVDGAHTRLLTVTGGGVTVTEAVFELPFSDAVTVTA